MAGDCFIKFKGKSQGEIKGESDDQKYLGSIDVETWSWGALRPMDGIHSTGKLAVKAFTFTHRLDASTPLLLSALANNEQCDAVLIMRRATGKQEVYFEMSFKGACLSATELVYLGESRVPSHSVTFTFAQLDMTYPKGQITWQYRA